MRKHAIKKYKFTEQNKYILTSWLQQLFFCKFLCLSRTYGYYVLLKPGKYRVNLKWVFHEFLICWLLSYHSVCLYTVTISVNEDLIHCFSERISAMLQLGIYSKYFGHFLYRLNAVFDTDPFDRGKRFTRVKRSNMINTNLTGIKGRKWSLH